MQLGLTTLFNPLSKKSGLESMPVTVQAPSWYIMDIAEHARQSVAQAVTTAQSKLSKMFDGYSPELKARAFEALDGRYNRDDLIREIRSMRESAENETREQERETIINLANRSGIMDYRDYLKEKQIPSIVAGQFPIKVGEHLVEPVCKEIYHGEQKPMKAFIEVSGAHIEVDASNWTGRGFDGFTQPRAIVEAVSGVRAVVEAVSDLRAALNGFKPK